ncbi:hypothetical protein NKR23_g8569 [Pleurostoma richardsiae]|uniref:DUF3669 domain-containing protein n=1 Tax=Pleurostoma richardsiae TaxID=41990 RepID=A0AA38RIB2_9PEZI|nr:hypothetical protein NKR23_g8569 [Pleurostoma richardsiae]
MADALAFLHWCARVDADDVEFVLALPPQPDADSTVEDLQKCQGFLSGTLGRHDVWVLDFDCCSEMSMDEDGIAMACRSFWRNDPYYPRPGSVNQMDQRLWHLFRERFLFISHIILRDEGPLVKRLPILLMNMIEETKGTFARGVV